MVLHGSAVFSPNPYIPPRTSLPKEAANFITSLAGDLAASQIPELTPKEMLFTILVSPVNRRSASSDPASLETCLYHKVN